MATNIHIVQLTLPNGWKYYFGAFILIALACLIWRRRNWLGIAALLSLAVFAGALVACALSWKHECGVGASWNGSKGAIMVGINSGRGRVRLEFEMRYDGIIAPWPGKLSAHYRTGETSVLLTRRDCSLLGKWPFIEEKIGFQLAHFPFHSPSLSFDNYSCTVPHWMAMVVICPWFPLLWYLRRRKRRRVGFPIAPRLGEPVAPVAAGTPEARSRATTPQEP